VRLGGVSRGDPNQVWGLLKDREGAVALQSFRGKLPERFQRLLEQYYKGLSRGSTSAGDVSEDTLPAAGRDNDVQKDDEKDNEKDNEE
jgi:hypothetical protein